MPRDRGLKRAFRRDRCVGALPGIRHRPSDSSTASNGPARTEAIRSAVVTRKVCGGEPHAARRRDAVDRRQCPAHVRPATARSACPPGQPPAEPHRSSPTSTCPGPRPPSDRTSSAFTASPIPLAAPAEALSDCGGRILLLRRAGPVRLPERPAPASRALPADPQPGPGQDDRDGHGTPTPARPASIRSPCGWGRPTTWVWIPTPATRTHRATSAGSTRSSRRRPGRALLLGSGAGVRRLDVAPAHGARGATHALPVGHLPRVGVRGV